MNKIILTGGPCGGKSTILKAIKKHFKGQLIAVTEVATALLENGFPPPNPWTEEWQLYFQAAIIAGQFKAESIAEKNARKKKIKLIVSDRGVLDGAAYLENGLAEFERKFKVSPEKIYKQYNMIIHLKSLAALDPDLYKKLLKTNPHRFETPALARKRESAILNVWAKHKNRLILSGGIEENKKQIIAQLTAIIKKESKPCK